MLGALTEWHAYHHLTPRSTLCCVGGKRAIDLLDLIIVIINIDDRDSLVRKEAVGSLVEHMGGVVAHNRLSLHMQVSHHNVTIPAAHHAYVVHVNTSMKECHGTTGPQGPGTYLLCLYARSMNVETHGVMEYICNVFCFDECPSHSTIVCGQRRIGS
jgi:hypothetical protein